jgi:opacity protein-like surface antigen
MWRHVGGGVAEKARPSLPQTGTIMKNLLLAGIALTALLTAPAMAADMAVKARSAPLPPPPPDWSGFYFGIHGGYGWKHHPYTFSNDFFFERDDERIIVIDGIKSKGAVFGAHAGYNWQYGGAVVGFEIDFSGASIKGSTTGSVSGLTEPLCEGFCVEQLVLVPRTITITHEDRVKYLGTARARFGWVPWNWMLLYGTAGLAWERLERTESFTDVVENVPLFSSTSTNVFDKFGWAAGVGAEVMLFGSSNWIGRFEYLHYDFGSVVRSDSSGGIFGNPNSFTRSGNQTIDVVRAGISYKFGYGMQQYGVGPARYY